MSNGLLRICTNEEMRSIDAWAETDLGIGPTLLMENAGRAAAGIIQREFPEAGKSGEILVFAGKGNNAGDAFVVARQLLSLGCKVRVFHLVKDYKGSTLANFNILKKLKTKLIHLDQASELESFFLQSPGPFWAVDGIIGTGLRGSLEGHFYDVVELINKYVPQVISLDIPTGVNGESGQMQGIAIRAAMTISFGFPRLGHFLPPGAEYCGKLINVNLSLPVKLNDEGDKFLLRPRFVAEKLKRRDPYAHKNTFGHTLVLGGSVGRTGAAALCAKAAHRMGSGLVTVATWADAMPALLSQIPSETMSWPIPKSTELQDYAIKLKDYSAIVIGPGLGMSDAAAQLLEALLKTYRGPMVIDADALNLMSEKLSLELCKARNAPTVLTPHPGEMARLLKRDKKHVVDQPIQSVKKAVELTHSVVMLKGAATLLSSPDDLVFLNHSPNPGLATAGSGDVLAGMIGGLLAQGMNAYHATIAGIYLHSLAGECAAQRIGPRGMLAGDVIESIPEAFRELFKRQDEVEGPKLVRQV